MTEQEIGGNFSPFSQRASATQIGRKLI